jgi:hypothetical protein
MASKRKAIRTAVAAALMDLTTTEDRVYTGRVYPSGAANVPGLNITTPSDRKSGTFPANRNAQVRELTVRIEARVKPADGDISPQDQLDDIDDETQTRLMADPTLSGLVLHGAPGDSSFTLSGKTNRPTGYAQIEWICEYLVDWNT